MKSSSINLAEHVVAKHVAAKNVAWYLFLTKCCLGYSTICNVSRFCFHLNTVNCSVYLAGLFFVISNYAEKFGAKTEDCPGRTRKVCEGLCCNYCSVSLVVFSNFLLYFLVTEGKSRNGFEEKILYSEV